MDKNHSQRVVFTLGLLIGLLAACSPHPGISTAQETAIAATGLAAANAG